MACRYANQTGVEIRPYKFGALAGVAALDPALPKYTGTFAPLIDALSEAGYVEGQDLFGAPYDFRLAADGLEQVCLAALTPLQLPNADTPLLALECCEQQNTAAVSVKSKVQPGALFYLQSWLVQAS